MALCEAAEFVRMQLIEWAKEETTLPLGPDGHIDRVAMRAFKPDVAMRVLGMHKREVEGEASQMGRAAPPDADALRAMIILRLAEVRETRAAASPSADREPLMLPRAASEEGADDER